MLPPSCGHTRTRVRVRPNAIRPCIRIPKTKKGPSPLSMWIVVFVHCSPCRAIVPTLSCWRARRASCGTHRSSARPRRSCALPCPRCCWPGHSSAAGTATVAGASTPRAPPAWLPPSFTRSRAPCTSRRHGALAQLRHRGHQPRAVHGRGRDRLLRLDGGTSVRAVPVAHGHPRSSSSTSPAAASPCTHPRPQPTPAASSVRWRTRPSS